MVRDLPLIYLQMKKQNTVQANICEPTSQKTLFFFALQLVYPKDLSVKYSASVLSIRPDLISTLCCRVSKL